MSDLDRCECGHGRLLHFRGQGSCLYELGSDVFACPCDWFWVEQPVVVSDILLDPVWLVADVETYGPDTVVYFTQADGSVYVVDLCTPIYDSISRWFYGKEVKLD